MRLAMCLVATVIAFFAVHARAGAMPIFYDAQLQNSVPVLGVINQPNGSVADPVGAEYYSFFANAGSLVSISGDRLSSAYDMSFWVMSGLFADTDDFGGALPGANFIAFADDENPPFIPGPSGDPSTSFIAPDTGFYTIAVTNFLSDPDPPFNFRLQATGVVNSEVAAVPEPSTFALFGVGLAVCAGICLMGRIRVWPSHAQSAR